MAVKTIKLGNKQKSKKGNSYLSLGNPEAKNDKYKFTVKVRIERPGQDPITLTNPRLFFADAHENAPDFIEAEVVFYDDDGQG